MSDKYWDLCNLLSATVGSNFNPFGLESLLETQVEYNLTQWRNPFADKAFWAERYMRDMQRLRNLRRTCKLW